MNVQVRDLSSVDRNTFVSQASYWIPELLNVSAWLEHAPFGFWLVGALRPRTIVELGVHTGFCVLNRTFAIKQMVRWGMPVALIRDVTDTLYNPARPPYVSHEEGTRLIVGYIEKFWCPTLTSDDLVI